MESRITSPFGVHSTAAEVAEGHDLSGRAVIVTGGASGIGLETVRALASIGAEITVTARDVEAAKTAVAGVAGSPVKVEKMELDDLDSVRDFVRRWGDKPLYRLINNAGVMAAPFGRTKQGFETQLGVNHVGHFLLTNLLTPALAKTPGARVVCLSSGAHGGSPFDEADPNFEHREYNPQLAYAQSKTANALFALEYDRRHASDGIHAYSLMPGVIHTPLMRHIPDEMVGMLMERFKEDVKTPEQGAATTVWATLAPELDAKGGIYLENCAEAIHTEPGPHEGVKPYARDPRAAAACWAWTERAIG